MTKILITGGTGLVGKHLQEVLKKNNHEVSILTRTPKKSNEFRWNIKKGYIDENAFENITHIIHLAGAGIADKRWSKKRKVELIDSRVQSANLLFEYSKKLNIQLEGFISASGIGYYGAITSQSNFKETDAPENDFISKICIEWEKAALQFKTLEIPVTILRTGIVLTKTGGALNKINTPLFLAKLGSGKQYMPWIHIEDLCALYVKAVNNNTFTGIFNASAPEHHTNTSFTKTLAKVTRKLLLPFSIPSFVLNLVLGELSVILLKGSKISTEKTSHFYSFKFEKLNNALDDLQ
ncbi:TIGR01777 family oxidoreductase [Tenacibaculum halocynthiae]|uniref:TIGR01777 family oxidoreductase n=1 Tax=Tenacibaculum halocynthiae TaxID=1254437 RepID=UPI003D64C586